MLLLKCIKAKFVAKGFNQQLGFDFTKSFSPVVKPISIRIVLTLALTSNWSIFQLDVQCFSQWFSR